MRFEIGAPATPSRYVYYDAQGVIVNIIVADLTIEEEALFFAQHQDAFGAVGFVQVGTDHRPMIGGSYDATSGVFSPPPQPETIVEETTNDDAPIE